MPFENGEYRPPNTDTSQKSENTDKQMKSNPPQQERYRESQPLSNEPSAGIGIAMERGDVEGLDTQKLRDVSEKQIFTRLRQSPEVLSLIQAVIDDVIGPGATFEYVGPNPEERGEESLRKAKRFWRRNTENYADAMVDELVVGDMYMYQRTVDESKVEEATRRILRTNYEWNDEENIDVGSTYVKNQLKQLTDMFEIQELKPISAVTVEHVINDFGDITHFRQKVNGEQVEIPKDQVMHQSYMNLNGKTYGYAPFLSIFAELDMLAEAKNHNAQVFQNAGVVNKVFKLPDEGPDDANFEMVKKTVAKYRELKNKHRDLVLTGDIEIEDLSNENAQMEFRQLAEYITNVLVMAWGVPPSRVGVDIGGGGAGGRATQISHEGYFKRIKRWQNKHAAFLNEELFEPVFNCRIEFNHPDTKQEIREADRDMRRLEVAKQYAAMGAWNEDKFRQYLDINQNDTIDDFDYEDVREKAAKLTGLQDVMLSDNETRGDSSDDARREMIRDGQRAAEDPRDEV